MADHLKIDLQLLEDTARALASLNDEFSNAGSIVHESHQAVGAADLISAMNSFASNWKDHRKSLVSSIGAIEKMVTAGHNTYTTVDGQLANSLSVQTQPTVGSGPR